MADERTDTAGGVWIPSLFDLDSEEESSCDEANLDEQYHPKQIPLDDVISSAPMRLSQLLEILMPRLQPHPQVKTLSPSDQQSFVQILVGELASQFSLIQQQIDDPFLSPAGNKELHRRIIVRVCSAVEEVYAQFVKRAYDVHQVQGGVFTPAAAMARLRAQLILQANKSINLPVIRRRVLQELHGPPSSRKTTAYHRPNFLSLPLRQTKKQSTPNLLDLGALSPKLTRMRVVREKLAAHLNHVISQRPPSHVETRLELRQVESPSQTSAGEEEDEIVTEKRREFSLLRKASSMPELRRIDLLHTRDAKSKSLMIKRYCSVDSIRGVSLANNWASQRSKTIRMGEYTLEQLSQDLQALVDKSTSTTHTSDSLEDLPPLLEAHIPGLSWEHAQRLKEYINQHYPQQVVEATTGIPASPDFPEEPPPLMMDDYEDYQVPTLNFEYSSGEGSSTGRSRSMVLQGAAGSSLRSSSFIGSTMDKELLSQSLPGSSCKESSGLSSYTREKKDVEGYSSKHLEPEYISEAGSVLGENECMSASLTGGDLEHNTYTDNVDLSLDVVKSPQYKYIPSSQQLPSDSRVSDCRDKGQLTSLPQSQLQPDTVIVNLPNQGRDVAEMSDTRVGERSMQHSIRLKPYPAVYNDLNGELDSHTVEQLDSKLKAVEQIHEVFAEISQTITNDHLNFEKDDILVPAINPQVPLELSRLTASSSLYHRKGRRVINADLHTSAHPPWSGNRREWLKNYSLRPVSEQPTSKGKMSSKHGERRKDYRKALSTEDYLKFTTYRSSDFLGLVHHLYDSSGGDSEEEEREREKRRALKELQDMIKAEEERRRSLLNTKMQYRSGMWNVNTVMMGGLASLPDEITESKSLKMDLSSIQTRFDRIWDQLEFPDPLRAEAAYTYSNPFLAATLPKVLHLWEQACTAVLQREQLLVNLELFEKNASAPARHFAKGVSSGLLVEAKRRSSHHKEINLVEKRIVVLANKLCKYGDVISYKGRDYLEKMSMDRTEMLYCIHQQRRQAVLQPALQVLSIH